MAVQRRSDVGRDLGGSQLDELLAASLQRTVTVAEHHRVGAVAEHLHLDVSCRGDELLDEHTCITEAPFGLRRAACDRLGQLGHVMDRSHAPAAAATRSLDHDRPIQLAAEGDGLVGSDRSVGAGGDGHTDLDRQRTCGDLVPQPTHGRSVRSDEGETGRRTRLDERRVLGEEAVAGMQMSGPRIRCRGEHGLGIEVGGDAGAREFDQTVGTAGVERRSIVGGCDRDRLAVPAPHDAHRDLAAVRDQQTCVAHVLPLIDVERSEQSAGGPQQVLGGDSVGLAGGAELIERQRPRRTQIAERSHVLEPARVGRRRRERSPADSS